MKNGYNIERLINLLSCSHCGTGFDESCIGLLEVSYDTVMVRIVCKECGKKYVLAFMDLNFSFFEATFGAPLEADAFKEDIKKEQNENNKLTKKLDLQHYSGKLNNGIYRIVKPVYDNGYIDIYSDEFEIK